MEHLIANSGIQFIVKEIEFNPFEPLQLPNGRTLRYSFIDFTDDFLNKFSLMYYHESQKLYIPIDELSQNRDALVLRPNGREMLDELGIVKLKPDCDISKFAKFGPENVFSVSSLMQVSFNDRTRANGMYFAFEEILDKWLPMPMYVKEIDGVTSNYPMGWCRLKIQKIGNGAQKNVEKFRLIWAFDTSLANDVLSELKPIMREESGDAMQFCLCNRVDLLLDFLSSGEDFHAFSDYIASLLGINVRQNPSRMYKAFYIYLINFIRLANGAPEITLHDNKRKEIDVDLVLDIGNSRTCGILFEEGKFTKSTMLGLHDLSSPWICYENKTFDMRVVFRKADFGNDIVLDEDLFQWKSFVRIGEEARKLVYRSLEEEGMSEKTNNYSSPKRYLWDKKTYEGQWENLVTSEDPFNVYLSHEVSIPNLSNLFEDDGTYNPDRNEDIFFDLEEKEHRYSRSSLMTFAYIEIFQHAITQINSIRYRNKWGDKDCRRIIRKVIVTCPTAMPMNEKVFLRESAFNAFNALTKCNPSLRMAQIIPTASSVRIVDRFNLNVAETDWSYDEAMCCQLTYLCAEIENKYSGEVRKFFDLKGHVRPELVEQGYSDKALTIGTIDIGAGTTDIMVCSYECQGVGNSRITPNPLFWDSFYLAGDNILRNLIQNLIIEGKQKDRPEFGSISSALVARMCNLTDDELLNLPCLNDEEGSVYRGKVDLIRSAINEEERKERLVAFASNLLHDFFGNDSRMMGYRKRRCRNDFNTQISVPIAQKWLELLRTRRPTKLYSFEDLFPDVKPADYLLDSFKNHFGFSFEELMWQYDPEEVASIVKSTMEPLMRQLAYVLYRTQCDIIVLAGRPSSLDPITELFVKYVPVWPNRLIRLNEYNVGNWFPTADGQGFFFDQKAVVAAGAMVGYMASNVGLNRLSIDFSKMIKKMDSTANYIGEYNTEYQSVKEALISPDKSTGTLMVEAFPAYIGCRQLDSSIYQARPLYAIYNNGSKKSLKVRLSRQLINDKENIVIEEALDNEFVNCVGDLELVQQSIADDGKYWLDKGEFKLTVVNNA